QSKSDHFSANNSLQRRPRQAQVITIVRIGSHESSVSSAFHCNIVMPRRFFFFRVAPAILTSSIGLRFDSIQPLRIAESTRMCSRLRKCILLLLESCNPLSHDSYSAGATLDIST